MLVSAFTGLGAPCWDAQARGAIVGLSVRTRRGNVAHLACAAVESIALQSAAAGQGQWPMAIGIAPLTELRVHGSTCVNNWLMQFRAGLLGIPVVRPRITETASPKPRHRNQGIGRGLPSGVGKRRVPPCGRIGRPMATRAALQSHAAAGSGAGIDGALGARRAADGVAMNSSTPARRIGAGV